MTIAIPIISDFDFRESTGLIKRGFVISIPPDFLVSGRNIIRFDSLLIGNGVDDFEFGELSLYFR